MPPVLFVLIAATVVGLGTAIGAVPVLVLGSIRRRAFDAILGFGAGLMLSAATLGLLGEALEEMRPAGGSLDPLIFVLILAGFAAGFIILVVVERLIPHEHAGGHHEHLAHGGSRPERDEISTQPVDERLLSQRLGVAISGALVFHRLPEGFAIGASFATPGGAPLGWLIAIAVGLQNICEGLVTTTPLLAAGIPRLKALAVTTATGLTVPVAAAAGYFFSRQIEGALPFGLALGAGSLVAVTSNEIIPETHSHGNEVPATVGIVFGFLFTIVLRAALGTH